MREMYTQGEAARALGVSRRTLYNWLRAGDIVSGISPGKARMLLTLAEVELLATQHKRTIRDIDAQPRDVLQEIAELREQVEGLAARVLRTETQFQTLTSLLGNRLSLDVEAGEQKSDPTGQKGGGLF